MTMEGTLDPGGGAGGTALGTAEGGGGGAEPVVRRSKILMEPSDEQLEMMFGACGEKRAW